MVRQIMKEEIITTDSGSVYYWLPDCFDNDKPTLFFLHGMTGNHSMFQEQTEYFFDKYNLVLWDAPAHGKSRPFEGFTYEKTANIIKQIFEKSNIPPAVFVGQSMGGFITQAVIKRFPTIVKAFVAIDSTPYGNNYYSKFDVFWLKQVEWMAYLCPAGWLKKAMARQISETSNTYNNMLSMLSVYAKKELCHLLGIGYAGFLDDNCDLDINCPVLLLLGEKDRTGKVKSYNKMWSRQTGYDLIIVENAGHNSNVDNPIVVNQEIEKFVEGLYR